MLHHEVGHQGNIQNTIICDSYPLEISNDSSKMFLWNLSNSLTAEPPKFLTVLWKHVYHITELCQFTKLKIKWKKKLISPQTKEMATLQLITELTAEEPNGWNFVENAFNSIS